MAKLVEDMQSLIEWLKAPPVDPNSDEEGELVDELIDAVRELQISQVENVDGVRKYVSLARYGDEVREAWRMKHSVEHTFLDISKPHFDPGIWEVDGDLFQYRVPIDLIDESTGKPKVNEGLILKIYAHNNDAVCQFGGLASGPILFEIFDDKLFVNFDCKRYKEWKEAGYQVEPGKVSYYSNGKRYEVQLNSLGSIVIRSHNDLQAFILFNLRTMTTSGSASLGTPPLPFERDAAGNLRFFDRAGGYHAS